MTEAIRTLRVDHLGLLSEEELAGIINVEPHTLSIWRSKGKGPNFARLGKSVFYRQVDVQTWIGANVVVATLGPRA
jgi:hypothetical protein